MRQDCSGECAFCSEKGRVGCDCRFDIVLKTDGPSIIVQKKSTGPDRCKVVAHRGFSYSAPENTLSSVVASIKAGADYCEFDVRMTLDRHVVLLHDSTLDRTTNGSGCVSQLTLKEISRLDSGQWKGNEYAGEKIATLDSALKKLKHSEQDPLIEIKDGMAWREVVDCVRGYSMEARAILLSPDEDVLELIGERDKIIRRAYLCESFPNNVRSVPARVEWLCMLSARVGVDIVDIDYSFLSAEMVSGLQGRGLEVWTWTINAPEIMRLLSEWGVDAIASDKPDLLKDVLYSNS